MAKKLILLLFLVSFSFSLDLNFKKTSLEKFTIQGFSSKITFENSYEIDMKISQLWDKFLNSKDLNLENSKSEKVYVVYSNYKSNSFKCFIGIKSDKSIPKIKSKTIAKSKYKKLVLKYQKKMNMGTIWNDIQKKKLNRNYKIDMEEYKLLDLGKDTYFINIFLSTN